jgi:ABC-type glycerol-3-phosphate transport system permease component
MSEMALVPQLNEGAVTQGTPRQFSNAAFFQRTFNSSRLKELLLVNKLLLIACGAWEKAKMGNKMKRIIFGYIIFDFMFYRLHWQDKTLKSEKINILLSVD